MCTDCGCSIRGMEEHAHERSHDGGETFHTHDHSNDDTRILMMLLVNIRPHMNICIITHN